MSAIGTKRTFVFAPHMSAIGGKADHNGLRCKCLLLTQSGHWPSRPDPLPSTSLTRYDAVS